MINKTKKAVFYSGLFLLICGTLMMSTMIFVKLNEERNNILSEQLIINKFTEITNYASYDYLKLLNIKHINASVLENTSTIIELSATLNLNNYNITDLVDKYSIFLNDKISNLDNIDINSTINNSIYISTTNDHITLDTDSITFSNTNIEELNITIQINESILDIESFTNSFKSGTTKTNIKIIDIYQNQILSRTLPINVSENNYVLLYFNSSTPSKKVNFTISDYTRITTKNSPIITIISSFKYTHSEKNQIYLNAGGHFYLKRSGIEKRGPLVLLSN